MKKYVVLILAALTALLVLAQTRMNFHLLSGDSDSVYVSEIDTIRFKKGKVILEGASKEYEVAALDSATFTMESSGTDGDTVFITYKNDDVEVVNPFESVTITRDGAAVTVVSAADVKDIVYCLSGSSDAGSFEMTPDRGYTLLLDHLSLSNAQSPIVLNSAADGESYTCSLHLKGDSKLSDGDGNSRKGAFYTKSKLKINEDGSEGALRVTGNSKHAINSSKNIELYAGALTIDGAKGDGINADALKLYGGELSISQTEGDAVDCSEKILVENGKVTLSVSADDVKGLKCDSVVEIAGGEIVLHVSGAGSKAIKSGVKTVVSGGSVEADLTATAPFTNVDDATDISYNGALVSNGDVEVSGDASIKVSGDGIAARAISADNKIVLAGGKVVADLSGAYNIETINKDTTSVFGLKADSAIVVQAGVLDVKIGASANIAKCVKADYVYINGGDITLSNNGGFWYTSTTSSSNNNNPWGGGFGGGGFGGGSTVEVNATTPKAIRGEELVSILGGNLHITVAHGKGITSDKSIVIGNKNGADNDLTLTINTGDSSDQTYKASSEKQKYLPYCGPKAIHSNQSLEVNSGTIDITTLDSGLKGRNVTVNGGKLTISAHNDQGIHGVQNLTINGGDILVSDAFEAFEGTTMIFNGGVTSCYGWDDVWNCSTSTSGSGTPSLTVNGGVHYLNVGSGDTDALDSNGSMSFQGGAVIVECGNVSLDCDATPAFKSGAVLMLFCKSSETLPSSSTNLAVTGVSANTRYTASAGGKVLSSFTTTQSATQLIYVSGSSATFTSGGQYSEGEETVIRGKNSTTMKYATGGTLTGGTTLTSKTASAQGMGGPGGGRW